MNKISEYFAALRKVKDRYNWTVEGGRIVARPKRNPGTSAVSAYVVAMREVYQNPRLRSDRNIARRYEVRPRYGYGPEFVVQSSTGTLGLRLPAENRPFHQENHAAARLACRGLRNCNTSRRRWVREMTLKLVGISGETEE
jgi:hypothetical protein